MLPTPRSCRARSPFRLYAATLASFMAAASVPTPAPLPSSGRPVALASLVPRIRFPAGVRRIFLSVSPIDIAVWALGGFTRSLVPRFVREATGSAFAIMGSTVVAIAALLLATGTAITLACVVLGSVTIMVAGTALAGARLGSGFLGVLRTALSDVAPTDRAGLIAALLTVSYLAFGLPAMAAGVAARAYRLVLTAVGYGAGTILLASASLPLARRQR